MIILAAFSASVYSTLAAYFLTCEIILILLSLLGLPRSVCLFRIKFIASKFFVPILVTFLRGYHILCRKKLWNLSWTSIIINSVLPLWVAILFKIFWFFERRLQLLILKIKRVKRFLLLKVFFRHAFTWNYQTWLPYIFVPIWCPIISKHKSWGALAWFWSVRIFEYLSFYKWATLFWLLRLS